MRPWLHIPALIFVVALITAFWVAVREVPLERSAAAAELYDPLAKLPPSSPKGVLQGVLIDELGAPIPGADLSTQQDGRVLWSRSDDQGTFALEGLQSGPLVVSVMVEDRLPENIAVRGPVLGTQIQLSKIPVSSPSLQQVHTSDWSGRIRNPLDRKSLSGFQVWLVPVQSAGSLSAGIPRRTQTIDNGEFHIKDLIHAPYLVHVLPPGDQGALQPNLLTPLGNPAPVLEHGALATPSEWTLQSGELFGSVQANGKPVRAAMVMLEALAKPDSESGISRVLPAIQTDETGAWSVRNLPPARYRIRIRGGGLNLEKEVLLGANQRLRMDL